MIPTAKVLSGPKMCFHTSKHEELVIFTFAKPVSTIRYAPSEKPSLFKSDMVMRDFPYASGQWGEGKQTLTRQASLRSLV